ncbi:MAG: hypothetical protein CME86_20345 [Herbaspirillum sp.]|nr:hypothetical protein [Herbaspirillum sp.]
MAAVALHFAGHIGHEKYLRYFGLDAGVFPRDTFGTQIIGYFVFSDFVSVVFETLVRNIYVLAAACLGITAYCVCFYYFMESPWVKRSRERAKGKQGGWRFMLFAFAMTMMFVMSMPVLFAMLSLVLSIPSELATTYAKRLYQVDMKHFRDGCWPEKKDIEYRCTEVKRDGKTLAMGFLIDSSSTHLAIYDVRVQKGLVFEREKTDLIGEPDEQDTAEHATPKKLAAPKK